MRVDAYTATIQDSDASELIPWLCEALPIKEQVMVGRDGGVPTWKYQHAVGIDDGKTRVANVRWGGNGDGVSIELKGSIAHETFGLLRAHHPKHTCSRMDVAIDLTAEGLFDNLLQRMQAIAEDKNPRVSMEPRGTGWYEPPTQRRSGRTMYFGSRGSDVQICLYEKGFERIARGAESELEADLNWVRAELRVHPGKRQDKEVLTTLTPSAAWGWSRWTAEMLKAISGLEAQAVLLPERASDDERTWRALIDQYGSFLFRVSGGHVETYARLREEVLETQRLKRRIGAAKRA